MSDITGKYKGAWEGGKAWRKEKARKKKKPSDGI
jgi:hypothetical protein